MFVSKTVKCKLIGLTNRKEKLLNAEYSEANRIFKLLSEASQFGDLDYFNYKNLKAKLYSLTKSNIVFRFKPKKNEQPMPLRNQKCKIKKTENKLADFWLNIPIYNVRGGVWVALEFGKQYADLIETGKLCDSQLIKRKGNFYAHLVFKKEIELKKHYTNVLAVDLGEKVIATVCGSFDNQKPLFYGRKVRGIRRHYAWLRKRLGEKKLLKKIKSINNTEQRKVNAILHEISRSVVNLAHKHDSLIVLGNLKGIRNSAKGKGRRFNRIVSSMPYLTLSNFIEYKANALGIAVAKIDERGTSKTCSRCGEIGSRKTQGLFTCSNCSVQLNADLNGARNIIKRSAEKFFADGVFAYALNRSNEIGSTH